MLKLVGRVLIVAPAEVVARPQQRQGTKNDTSHSRFVEGS